MNWKVVLVVMCCIVIVFSILAAAIVADRAYKERCVAAAVQAGYTEDKAKFLCYYARRR